MNESAGVPLRDATHWIHLLLHHLEPTKGSKETYDIAVALVIYLHLGYRNGKREAGRHCFAGAEQIAGLARIKKVDKVREIRQRLTRDGWLIYDKGCSKPTDKRSKCFDAAIPKRLLAEISECSESRCQQAFGSIAEQLSNDKRDDE